MSNLFQELNRRNVFRVGIAYVVASWVLLQVVDVLTPILQLPEWTPRFIFLVLAVCLIPALIVAWAYELTPDGLKRESEVDREQSVTDTTGRKLNNVILGVMAIAVVFLLIDRTRTDDTVEPPVAVVAEDELAAAPNAAPTQSIAVLPFVNMSQDEDFFSDGITEEILNALAGVRELKVAGRTSAFAFKGKNEDLRLIGETLGVEHILEGSVRKDGETVRITAQLIHVEDGFHLWSETYDRKLDNVFAIQDEISNKILEQLSITLLGEPKIIDTASTTDPATYQLYLRAKQKIYTRDREQLRSAADDLNNAIKRDPNYASAYAQRGIVAMLLSETQYGETPHDEANRRGERFLKQAIRLEPDNDEALGGMGLYYSRDGGGGDRDLAIDYLSKALEVNPSHTDARNWLQIALADEGRPRDALAMLEAIADIDPMYMPAFSNGINMFAAFGEEEKGRAWIERLKVIDPENSTILFATAINHSVNGRIVESIAAMQELSEREPISGARRLIYSLELARVGDYQRIVDEDLFLQAFALWMIGDEDAALARAERWSASGWPQPLINLYANSKQHDKLTAYIEEGWPSLSNFADEYPGDVWDYDVMMRIANAYRKTGNQDRFNEALSILDAWELNMISQGVSNDYFTMARGALAAMRGERAEALAFATKAVEEFGWADALGIARSNPALEILKDDPDFIELERNVRERVNAARAAIELPPLEDVAETEA